MVPGTRLISLVVKGVFLLLKFFLYFTGIFSHT